MVKSDGPDIFRGAMNGDVDEVREALAQNPDLLNFQEEKIGATPLHVAVWYGNYDVVDFLCLQPEIDIGLLDSLGRPTWFGASATGRDDIVERIFEDTNRSINRKIATEDEAKQSPQEDVPSIDTNSNVTHLRPKPPSV